MDIEAPCEPTALHSALESTRTFAQALLAEHPAFTPADWVQVTITFRRTILPRRKGGRKRSPKVTAALMDWQAGMRGIALFQKHIRGWSKMSDLRREKAQRRLLNAIHQRNKRRVPLAI